MESLAQQASGRTVARVCIGLGYMAVVLDDGSAGLAYTFRREAQGGCTLDMSLRPLAGRSAADLLRLTGSDNRIEAALGLACANALAGTPPTGVVDADVLDYMDVHSGDRVAMVGYFGPLVAPLRQRSGSLTVFEQRDVAEEGIRPAAEAPRGVRGCDVVLVTATSLINHTMDALLMAAQDARQVVVLGASTPLVPEVFAHTPVTLLSGVIPRDVDSILTVLQEAGGMQVFRRFVRKVNVQVG